MTDDATPETAKVTEASEPADPASPNDQGDASQDRYNHIKRRKDGAEFHVVTWNHRIRPPKP